MNHVFLSKKVALKQNVYLNMCILKREIVVHCCIIMVKSLSYVYKLHGYGPFISQREPTLELETLLKYVSQYGYKTIMF